MPLQKSFSDQNHSFRQPRSNWQRHRSHQDPQKRNNPNEPEITPDKSLVPISSVTKNKLNVFHFRAQNNGQDSKNMAPQPTNILSLDNKENLMVVEKQKHPSRETTTLTKKPSQCDTAVKIRDAPTTPAGRLALPDLIGMVDVQGVEQRVSPDERIMWDHDEGAIHSSASSYKAMRRVKKRARSSSPVSSPARQSAQYSAKGAAFDLHHLSQSLKTPQADPGHDLWGRYGFDTGHSPQQGQQLPGLVHIMETSSPQSSKDQGFSKIDSSLRRSIGRSSSCGTDWPKRRRVGVTEEASTEDIFTEPFNAGPSKLSMVSALLEKVQEGLSSTGKPRPLEEPSSSSSFPRMAFFSRLEERSPLLQKAQEEVVLDDSKLAYTRQFSDQVKDGLQIEIARAGSAISDYGDIEEDVFEETIAGTMDANFSLSSAQHAGGKLHPLPSLTETSLSRVVSRFQERSNPAIIDDKGDQFYDSDEDVCAEDLENIVAKYDTGMHVELADASLPTKAKEPKLVPAKSSLAGRDIAQTDSDDDYGDGFSDIDFETAEAAATQSLQHLASSPTANTQKSGAIQRYLITNVLDSQYETSRGALRVEKVLLVQVEETKALSSIHLRDGWIDTPATPKAFVHVIGDFSNGRCVVDDLHNMVILHPDHLISSTVLADSFSCTRRAILQDRVKATSAVSPPLVYGTMLHEIFQAALMANRWDSDWLGQVIGDNATRHLEDLYTIKIQIPQAVEYLTSKMGEMQSWAELYVSSQPKADAVVKAGNGGVATMCVSKLLDVEEHVWSPMYGLKGNIDATVQVTMKDGKDSRTLTVPFEVKTGKTTNASHRAQTALYNLLLSDRYDVNIAYGILYYMETSETHRIPVIRHELRHMIMQRNELACFVRERHAQLPPMVKKENLCNRCYAQTSCFIYHRLADDGNGETSGLKSKFDEAVKHLTPKHKEFFLKWDDLLTKEEKESLKFRRELWTMYSSEREKVGRCFSNVIIEPGSAYEEQNNPKINRFRYTLIKEAPSPTFSFLESQITVGEPIVISDEEGHFALANGFVTNVRKRRIIVAVDRRLHNARIRGSGFDETNNQVFASIMDVEDTTGQKPKENLIGPPVLYRLDKDEFSNGLAAVRNNLIQVMAEGPFGSREIRSLVVDLVPPRFKPHSTAYTLTDRANINIDQRRAIEKVMSAQDYALVLGMPGTGKTTTIAHIIRALVSQRKSVLLTSYTHTAVDNILLKLKDDKIPILRLGSIAKVNADVQDFALMAERPKTTFAELRSSWHDSPVVATTCLGINHAIFNERTFDYCIVDEASQITLPVCLGPIRMAHTFVLVGDHNQLPPLVQNEEARTGGLDISLFKHLSDMHPFSVVNLEHQYRMCEDVMALSNNLIYNGHLKCGTPEVAARSIIIPNMDALRKHHYSPSTLFTTRKSICVGSNRNQCWLRDLLDPSTKVSFVNTDPLLPASREEAKGNRIVNTTEATICTQLVESLLSVGVPANSIGVMTHYRSQLALLKHGLRAHSDVEMHTADRFQGRDKEVIILSLVRSNEAKSIGELLKDWRRINVAFTRAKTKLLVVGSRETLTGNTNNSEEMVAKFVRLMEERGWVYNLPKAALESHLFDDFATQVSAGGRSQSAGPQWKKMGTEERSPVSPGGKENAKPSGPKRVRIGERALLAGNPVMRNVLNDLYGA